MSTALIVSHDVFLKSTKTSRDWCVPGGGKTLENPEEPKETEAELEKLHTDSNPGSGSTQRRLLSIYIFIYVHQ